MNFYNLNFAQISQNTIYEILDQIKAAHIFDVQGSFDRQTQERETRYKSEVAALTKKKR